MQWASASMAMSRLTSDIYFLGVYWIPHVPIANWIGHADTVILCIFALGVIVHRVRFSSLGLSSRTWLPFM